ncbi:MAG: methionine synthase [Eggerthellaceae bacterium]|nr:methionine synthase [Eggerthellaceae bacterium]
MPDIQLRFHQDVLVLSAPPAAALRRIGLEDARAQQLALLLEPETVEDAYQLEVTAGPQALCALTGGLTPIRLAKTGMEGEGEALAKAALSIVRGFKPQHVIAPLAPCGLPLDPWNAASLKENRAQYTRAAKLLKEQEIDAILLDSFESVADLKCALMGIRLVTSAPVIAVVKVDGEGLLADGRGRLAEALEVMADLQASVAGFATEAAPEEAVALAREAVELCDLPLMVQLDVRQRDAAQMKPTPENPYYCPDAMVDAALALQQAGVQFLRAGGNSAPAYTGALAATVADMSVVGRTVADEEEGTEPPLDQLLSESPTSSRPEAEGRSGEIPCAPNGEVDSSLDDDAFARLMAKGRASIDAALGKRTAASPDIVVEDDDEKPLTVALAGEFAGLEPKPSDTPAEAITVTEGE